MDIVTSSKSRNKLQEIRENVKQAHDYFRPNYQRYHEFRKFIFKTSLSPTEINILDQLQKPKVEFNILESYISRLCGEFANIDPMFSVRAIDGIELIDPALIQVVEAHLKAAFKGAYHDSLAYEIYKEQLSGGFSVAEIYTDWANDKSFDQNIFVQRVFDPTLCGFDPLAKASHKGDGRYCFQNFPKTKQEAIKLYGSDIVKQVAFTRTEDEFNWSYHNDHEEILIICNYFEKKIKKTRILKLANGYVVTEKEYEKLLEYWEENNIIEQVPAVLKARWSDIETIKQIRCSGSTIIDEIKTDFKYFPLVFFDGNSVELREEDGNTAMQYTRPYVYQAKDAQKLKNFAGQTLANEMENMMQTKIMACIEGIPDRQDYLEAYINPQKASVLIYNHLHNNNPDVSLPPPTMIPRVPTPPEVSATFIGADTLCQTILGNYDAAMGINGNDISGVAIEKGAMHSNAAAKPFMMGFINGWNRLGQVYLDLMPKYLVTPRTIPIITPEGKREYVRINEKGQPSFNMETRGLEVSVEAGVNFEVQKQVALRTMVELMKVSPQFNAFMSEEGGSILLDNIDCYGIDSAKIKFEAWSEKQKQMQEEARKKQAQMPDPAQMAQQQMQMQQAELKIQAAKILQQAQEAKGKQEAELTKIATDNAIKSKEADIKFLEVMSKIDHADADLAIKQEKVDAENARSAVEAASQVMHTHMEHERHRRDILEKSDIFKDDNNG